jgi:hypothetical protein
MNGPRSSSFWVPLNLFNHIHRQSRIRDAVLVKSIERLLLGAKHCRGGWGGRGKDDRKHNKLVPLYMLTERNANIGEQ